MSTLSLPSRAGNVSPWPGARSVVLSRTGIVSSRSSIPISKYDHRRSEACLCSCLLRLRLLSALLIEGVGSAPFPSGRAKGARQQALKIFDLHESVRRYQTRKEPLAGGFVKREEHI